MLLKGKVSPCKVSVVNFDMTYRARTSGTFRTSRGMRTPFVTLGRSQHRSVKESSTTIKFGVLSTERGSCLPVHISERTGNDSRLQLPLAVGRGFGCRHVSPRRSYTCSHMSEGMKMYCCLPPAYRNYDRSLLHFTLWLVLLLTDTS